MNEVRGNVLRLRGDKGYGFLRGQGTDISKEYFFHASDCVGVAFLELHEEMPVVFLPEKTEKGWRARNVSLPQ